MLRILSANRTLLGRRETSLYYMGLRAVLQLRYDVPHERMLDLLPIQPLVPVCYHFILDSDKIILCQYVVHYLVRLVALYVVLSFICTAKPSYALVMVFSTSSFRYGIILC